MGKPVSQTGKLRKARLSMLACFPFCYWCEAFVREYSKEEREELKRKKVPGQPADMATIDHVNSRYVSKPRRGQWVLSCASCNQRRARQEEKELGIEEMRRRAGRYPSISVPGL